MERPQWFGTISWIQGNTELLKQKILGNNELSKNERMRKLKDFIRAIKDEISMVLTTITLSS
ncbi:1303_t:CDS:2 [Rhizophagus irregularis]|nr:1303_t:CDS:2 [Rhizophagus irregularis]